MSLWCKLHHLWWSADIQFHCHCLNEQGYTRGCINYICFPVFPGFFPPRSQAFWANSSAKSITNIDPAIRLIGANCRLNILYPSTSLTIIWVLSHNIHLKQLVETRSQAFLWTCASQVSVLCFLPGSSYHTTSSKSRGFVFFTHYHISPKVYHGAQGVVSSLFSDSDW